MTDIKCPGDCTDTGCCAPKKPKPVVIEFLYAEEDVKALKVLERAIDGVKMVLNASGLYIELNKKKTERKQRTDLPFAVINGREVLSEEFSEKRLMSEIIKLIYEDR